MYRAVSLLVVLAHLGVASTPCVERVRGLDLPATGPQHAQSASAPTHQRAQHDAGHPDPSEHAHHRHPDQAAPADAAEVEPKLALVLHELRALCLCGCGKHSQSPGTTTSPRVGFALFPPGPARLLEAFPCVDAPAADRMPPPRADPLDHIPIFS